MNRKIDCQIFGDQLDSWKQGTLADDMVEQLLSHAQSCKDCATLLRMHEELTGLRASELEAMVPDDMVTSMWSRVERAISPAVATTAARGKSVMDRFVGQPVMKWLVPVQAVAIAAMLVGAGMMFGELKTLRDRERTLLERLDGQEQRINELDLDRYRASAARAGGFVTRPLWGVGIDELERLTVAELRAFLANMPGDTQLLGRAEAERLLRRIEMDRTGVRNDTWHNIVVRDGLQADEALALINALELSPGDPGPAKWLSSFAQKYNL